MPYIDGLPLATSVNLSDVIMVDQGGTVGIPGTATTRQATVAMFASGSGVYMPLAGGTFTGAVAMGSKQLSGSDVVVTGGSVDGTAIGGSAQAAGAFTTLSATSTVSGAGFTAWAASPPAIGGSAPAAGAFTTLSATSTVSGAGFTAWAASPPAIGGTAPAAGAFTTLSASGTVSGSGFSTYLGTYLGSPPSIGATAPAAGKFTTLAATSTITPASVAGIVGTTTNDSAQAGSVGEYISSTVLIGSAISTTSATPVDITTISLTAGDWDVYGVVITAPAGSTTTTFIKTWFGTSSATPPTAPAGGGYSFMGCNGTAGVANTLGASQRISVASTTTIYLSTSVNFGASTLTSYGFIGARRAR